MKKKLQLSIFILLSFYCLILQAASAEIDGARIWPAPDSTRLVFDLSDPVAYKIFTLPNPERIVIDIKNSHLSTNLKSISLENTDIKSIRAATRNQHDVRVVIDLKRKLKYENFLVKPNSNYGNRLVIDLFDPEKKEILSYFTPKEDKTPPQPVQATEDFLVAIDAGHGGEDPGAIGPRGTREKDVVLQVAKKLHYLINKEAGMRAILVRKGDYFIGLRKRMTKARQQRADLFISIHADGFNDPRAKGASVYVVSARGSSSEAARWLAEHENRSDLIGGVSLDDKSDLLASVLLDLSQTASKVSSLEVASLVLNQLKQVTPLHKQQVEHAGFAVLKSPDIPSILVETAFISNPQGENQLRTADHQQKLARAIMLGVRQFKDAHPRWYAPSPSAVMPKAKRYKVRAGDSLSQIAERFKLSVTELKRLNRLRNDQIKVGQELVVGG